MLLRGLQPVTQWFLQFCWECRTENSKLVNGFVCLHSQRVYHKSLCFPCRSWLGLALFFLSGQINAKYEGSKSVRLWVPLLPGARPHKVLLSQKLGALGLAYLVYGRHQLCHCQSTPHFQSSQQNDVFPMQGRLLIHQCLWIWILNGYLDRMRALPWAHCLRPSLWRADLSEILHLPTIPTVLNLSNTWM